MIVQRSIDTPIRQGLSLDDTWHREDDGLIGCWERGRKLAADDPSLGLRARQGELVPTPWKGGLNGPIKTKKVGPLYYYATWLGLRGEDLLIDTDQIVTLTCTKYLATVSFSGRVEDYGKA